MKKFMFIVCALTVLVSCSKDNENGLNVNGEESANLTGPHEFKLINTLTERGRGYGARDLNLSYDKESGVVKFTSIDSLEARAIKSGLDFTGFQYEYTEAYTSEGVNYPYQFAWIVPQADKIFQIDNKVVPSQQ
ncbi:hypothetical protein Barb7_02927 [Bacteroidales bacterium Barb7]|nr:hypothetical protein Barb7_02927 [Bacteroidales bacterium Barb7]